MAEITSPRTYLPECYYDEICPAGRAHPSDWIDGPAGDRYWLAKDDEYADYQATMAVGEIVPFMWEERYPAVEIEVTAEGYKLLSPDPGGNMYWLAGDFDSQGHTLDSFVEGLRQLEPDLVGLMTVEVIRWADEAEPWRLDIGLDGPCFAKVEAANA